MSSMRKAAVMEYPRVEIESSPFEHPTKGLLTHAVESADFAEIVRKLSKSTWFCEVAEVRSRKLSSILGPKITLRRSASCSLTTVE